ncbi:MAG: AmmeMemoRadiSam system protein B [Candidatus Portnoybacteria bacterium CG10_big_fil_rev_8_21_14_0_10_44_7]|uniref:AmmeMemoRadiSam system protein B n=1 Tax=Candidatus Portnoybacteria bacterium CG10_big_fil_rev_8_21_14_0_10_44_7 TaxID=1974816 RepID=A0A2M8KII1_9BACT|nr:MAG: AmmeMemoRadiSam system protein B [Candidatus Portnoybacteria bacterium CG10_big_fil_rev_8_21_14_0_10_44_7]
MFNHLSENKKIRPARFAGQFYSAEPGELRQEIAGYLALASATKLAEPPKMILVPHAGYMYSGPVAARAYNLLTGTDFTRVILLGRSHNASFAGVAADTHQGWQTPLGKVLVDQKFILALARADKDIFLDSAPHQGDHILEAQLPFLQAVLSAKFQIAPLVLGSEETAFSHKLAQALAALIDKKTLVVISSDLAHYPPGRTAQALDQKTLALIAGLDEPALIAHLNGVGRLNIPNLQTLACGGSAILTGMRLAQILKLKPKILGYQNSGDRVPQGKDRVVGYGAVAFFT